MRATLTWTRRLARTEAGTYSLLSVAAGPEGATQMQRPVRLLMPIVVAVVLGPLIAGLAVCVLATVSNLLDLADSLPMLYLFKMFGFFVVFAYIKGAGIALLAGYSSQSG